MLKRREKLRRQACLSALSVLAALGAMVAVAPAARAASTLVVPRDFSTIQAAVDAAASGDTVVVRAGTYTEQVVVSGKDVNLRGAGNGAAVIKAPATLTSYGVNQAQNNRPVSTLVRIAHGAHVRMTGFTVTGPVPCGPSGAGVSAMQDAVLDLSDSAVTDIHPDASCPAQQAGGRGVVFGLPEFILVDGVGGSTASGRISHVTIARYLQQGINLGGPAGAATPTKVAVADNVISGGTPIPAVQTGIFVGESAVATVTGNAVSDSVCSRPGCGPDPINDIQSAGILVSGVSPGSTRVSGNHVAATDVGIYQFASPNCCRISDNTLTDNRFFGIVIQDGDGETRGNMISGGRVGIGVVADAVNTTGTLRGDMITGSTDAPVREIQCCGFTATAVVKPD
ncbi:right-handed parallel beta-helix repeat-containing protein [Kitasatospora sp. NPDC093558]|uniref:right-handed parallel beta-helix repeat-containing protein n=1 Tax=Kitasatospora sp. NPDC093558 TaxID=3155201 RepID=UPI0034453BE8